MQGIFIDGRRPKSKKEIREIVALDPARVRLEATSMAGNEYDGLVSNAPSGIYVFVGPDPYKNRKFYGRILKRSTDGKLVVQ